MSSTTRLAIVGAAGRMGQRLVALAGDDAALNVAYSVDQDGPALADIATSMVDVVVDFSVRSALAVNAAVCGDRAWAYVCGTTGLDEADHVALDEAASGCAVLWAPNFSIGINTLLKLVGEAARMLGDDFDLEIVEAHHRHKVDAPSGTARALGVALASARGWDYAEVGAHRPEGLIGARPDAEIGMSVIRGGSVVGDHSVLYLGPDEQLTLSHHASNRDIFARGALRAAKWLHGKPAGRYTMADVLG